MKAVANIEIVLDDSPFTEFPSSTTQSHVNGYNFRVVLTPRQDMRVFKFAGVKNPNLNTLQTVLAHELGHVVSYITNDPSHNQESPEKALAAPHVPAETKAWEIASEIQPDFDVKIRDFVLDEYRKMDKENEEEN